MFGVSGSGWQALVLNWACSHITWPTCCACGPASAHHAEAVWCRLIEKIKMLLWEGDLLCFHYLGITKKGRFSLECLDAACVESLTAHSAVPPKVLQSFAGSRWCGDALFAAPQGVQDSWILTADLQAFTASLLGLVWDTDSIDYCSMLSALLCQQEKILLMWRNRNRRHSVST